MNVYVVRSIIMCKMHRAYSFRIACASSTNGWTVCRCVATSPLEEYYYCNIEWICAPTEDARCVTTPSLHAFNREQK